MNIKKNESASKFIFNKIYTGTYLNHNLGHEIINFIKTDNNERYIYLNPWGSRDSKKAKKLEYVIHFMGVSYRNKKQFELIAISKIDTKAKSIYNKDPNKEIDNNVSFQDCTISEIFKNDEKKAHLYSFKASKFYIPKDKYRIFINFKSNKSSLDCSQKNNNIITINVKCYTNHSIVYSKDEDDKVLEKLIENNYLEEKNDNINLDKCDDEQCFAVISDRTNLEDSLSNQIAYFLSRDKNILEGFMNLIYQKAKNNKDKPTEITREEIKEFKIFRENHNIDLLFKSNDHVIVIENKIDSYINGISNNSKQRKNIDSQLSKYYKYVIEDKEFEGIDKNNKLFFIIEPEYSSITRDKLDKDFNKGNKYNIIYYKELRDVLENNDYNPYNIDSKENEEKRKFLYEQFKKGIEHVSYSKAEQNQKVAYIRLNQRIKELKSEKQIKIR